MREADEKASAAVGNPPYPLARRTLPTTQQMNDLKEHIREMKVNNNNFAQYLTRNWGLSC